MYSIKHVRPGQPIEADTINKIIDNSMGVPSVSGEGYDFDPKAIIVSANNIGSFNFGIGDVAIIKGECLSNKSGGMSPLLTISKATSEDDLTAICVCIEPIRSGQTGHVAISGLLWIKSDGGDGKYGRLEAENSFITIGESGSVQVFAKDNLLALGRFPVGSSVGNSTLEYQIIQSLGFCTNAG